MVKIYSRPHFLGDRIIIEDNAGLYQPAPTNDTGLGLKIVEKRLINQFGKSSMLIVDCDEDVFTKVSFVIPQSNKGYSFFKMI